MSAFYWVIIGIVVFATGGLLGWADEGPIKRRPLKLALGILGGIGAAMVVIAFFAYLIPDEKASEYWTKTIYPIEYNPGDDKYYIDLGERYYQLSSDLQPHFKIHEDADSVIVYRPGPDEILWGAFFYPAIDETDHSKRWEIRLGEDIIYEKYVRNQLIKEDLK